VRVWQLPVETFLNGGLGILPLAPLSTVTENELPAVIAQMEQRIRAEATPEEAGTLWTAADVLMGLRYPRDLVAQLLQGVHGMKESVTYQAIVEEGKMEGKIEARQEVLLELGQKRFGTPDASTETAVRAIADLERLKQLSERLLDASSWEELLGAP
jgi:predicted transposase YdaD